MTPVEELQDRLLRIGGTSVRGLDNENVVQIAPPLLQRGTICKEPVQLAPTGIDGGCHLGTLALFLLSSKRVEVWTGFALAPDWHSNAGQWAEHSWAKHDGTLIETTLIPREGYVGYRHSNPAAWGEDELRRAGLWRDDSTDYLELFHPESWDLLLSLINTEEQS